MKGQVEALKETAERCREEMREKDNTLNRWEIAVFGKAVVVLGAVVALRLDEWVWYEKDPELGGICVGLLSKK